MASKGSSWTTGAWNSSSVAHSSFLASTALTVSPSPIDTCQFWPPTSLQSFHVVGGLWLSLCTALQSHSLRVPFGEDTLPPGQRGTLQLVACGCGGSCCGCGDPATHRIPHTSPCALSCTGGHARACSLSPFVVLLPPRCPLNSCIDVSFIPCTPLVVAMTSMPSSPSRRLPIP